MKDVWWGSLAGVFLANIVPPITGFESLEEFILHEEKVKEEESEHKFKEILAEMEKLSEGDKNVPNGQV